MAQQLTMARPYAKAVFKDAVEQKLLQPWSEVLQILASIAQNQQMVQFIANPTVQPEERQQLFYDLVNTVAQEAVSKLGNRLTSFIALLTTEKRLLLLPEMAMLYQELFMQEQGVIAVDIISAFPVSQDHREQLRERLEVRFQSSVELNFIKDETLIGGTIIRAGHWVMDDSIKGKLSRLADNLM